MACHFCKISSIFHLRRHINLRVGGRLSKTPEKRGSSLYGGQGSRKYKLTYKIRIYHNSRKVVTISLDTNPFLVRLSDRDEMRGCCSVKSGDLRGWRQMREEEGGQPTQTTQNIAVQRPDTSPSSRYQGDQ